MNLAQNEIIQILRKRADMNQGQLGAKAFDTTFESGRTKIKNIELGRQNPSDADIAKIAKALRVAPDELRPVKESKTPKSLADGGVRINKKVLEYFPSLGPYLNMLNNAVMVDDGELIAYIARKISEVLVEPNQALAADG